MVITRLQGGLGNQLFQYAVGRELALRLNTNLLFDTSYYLYVRNRHYILNAFQTVGREGLLPEILFRKQFGKPTIFKESQYYSYNSGFESLKGNIYLDGWWQNTRYFSKHSTHILHELSFKTKKVKNFSENSVSIHVRRGDYTKLSGFGVCSPAYYKNAIERIKRLVKKPVFYVFGDDLDWVHRNLSFIPNPIFTNGLSEMDDFCAMRGCRHHIIANSTFSWWAAKLANKKNQIVIAPFPWLSSASDADALCLPSWIQIRKN